MNEQQESNDKQSYVLNNTIQQLPRDLQTKIFKYFHYCSVTLTIFTDRRNYVRVSIPHAYTNIDYMKEQMEICTGIPKENQSYFYGQASMINPDRNLIDYNITWGKVLENIHSWSKSDIVWRFGLQAWE